MFQTRPPTAEELEGLRELLDQLRENTKDGEVGT